jgi:hypothetical protein
VIHRDVSFMGNNIDSKTPLLSGLARSNCSVAAFETMLWEMIFIGIFYADGLGNKEFC